MRVPIPLRALITLALAALITGLSIAPGIERSGDDTFGWLVRVTPASLQNFAHLLCYAALAAACLWTLEPVKSGRLRVAAAFTFSASLGAYLEWQQTGIPGRYGNLADVILNALGAFGGLLAASLLF